MQGPCGGSVPGVFKKSKEPGLLRSPTESRRRQGQVGEEAAVRSEPL